IISPEEGDLKGLRFGLSSDDTYSLRITNTTSHNSGTYGCILWAPAGKHNQSGTIILKVTGCTEQLDEKFKKYRAELLLLSCLGIFYLLLIFFTCVSNVFYMFAFRSFLLPVTPSIHSEKGH
uniref:CD83 molecule n=1 Tax=Terrapene triunguis TaxID=2587831 RepID=A0A674HYM2_9SAUR